VTTIAGARQALVRLSHAVKDPESRRAVQALETKLDELDRRLTDVERRLSAGGL
jgi:hypothetical protein